MLISLCNKIKTDIMKHILVAIDFDTNEQKLLNVAFEFAHKFKAKLWLIHITAPDPEFVGYDVGPQYIRDNRASELKREHKILQDYANDLEKKGIKADGLLIQGATIDMIMEEADTLNVDLIAIGRLEHSFLYKAFFGSVTEKIVKTSDIPVLVVPLD